MYNQSSSSSISSSSSSAQPTEPKKRIVTGYGVPRQFPEKVRPPKPDNLPGEVSTWLNSLENLDKS